MRCTVKKTFQAASEADIGLIVQVKENQPTLHRQVHRLCASVLPQDYATSKDTGRNRQETRTIAVFDPANAITDPDWHACISSIIRVERQVHTRNAKTGLWDLATHTACYLANTPMTASRAADSIRAHWTIENTSHYSRDVTMGGVAQGSSRDSGWNSNGDTVLRVKPEKGHPEKTRMFSGCGSRRGHRPAACGRQQSE